MYILNFNSYQQECQIIAINKPRISVAFVQDINHIRYFFAKRKTSFEVSTFGGLLFSKGSLLSGFANTFDFLSLLSEVRYFRGSLLSELFGLLSLWTQSYGVTIQMKPLQQYFHMVLFI